ncbi:hypothetical protein MXB_1750 [Myxobolus squamalis]|nr:hypothetical protein MXB_1750 [Myxobolus squamalis]
MLQNINDRMKINFIDISKLQNYGFSYRTYIDTNYFESDQIHYKNIQIDILRQKYYYYNLSNQHLDIILLIHCEMHENINAYLRPKCTAKNGKTVCDINGKEICVNRKMAEPPYCRTSN